MKSKAKDIVGEGRECEFKSLFCVLTSSLLVIIDPNNLSIAFVSPRQRSHKTFNLLTEHLPEKPKYVLTEEVREWDYGEYEGLKPREIKEINPSWTVWKDG
jgi:probable phosphoglycerate mutase